MAKNKPNVAFLEALKQEKKRRGEDTPGGGFKTPDWFFNTANQPQSPSGAIGPQDPSRSRPRLNFKYALLGGIVLILVVVVAYMAGRGESRPQMGPSTPDVQKQAPNPMVMEGLDPGLQPQAPVQVPPTPQPPVVPVPQPAAVRSVGLTYAVIYSSLSFQDAQEIARQLKQSGIDCTVESNHPVAPKYHTIIGTTAFTKSSELSNSTYIKRVQQAAERLPTKYRFKAQPYGMTWK